MNKLVLVISVVTTLLLTAPALAGKGHDNDNNKVTTKATVQTHAEEENDGHAHGAEAEGDEEDEHGEGGGSVDFTPENMKAAGVIVEPVIYQNLENEINAPGEVTLNSYLSSKITPRIEAQVIARHAKLGDTVKKGDVLVTLSSVTMAEAVGELLVASKEWSRVKRLGPSAVSAKRYSEAKIANEQAKAKVIAYGMTEAQVKELLKKGMTSNLGNFQLLAIQDGTIVSDNFIEGEIVEAGRILFDIVNEDILWVESKLSPEQAKDIKVGAVARVHIPTNGWIIGKVIQKHHLLDRETRTIGIRIELNNEDDRLHPGMYVETKIQTGEGEKYLAVPTKAILRSSDGDWIVFVEQEKAGEFKPVEIQTIRSVDDYTVIDGIDEGTRVVVSGAFFVQSELAKSGFAVHNH